LDSASDAPLGWATILVVETGRGVVSHEDGRFELRFPTSGLYTLRASRIGYDPQTLAVRLEEGEAVELTFRLTPAVYRSRMIEIVGDREMGGDVEADRVISGRALRQQLGRTLAETLVNEPGLTQTSMGPAPARPVLRGLAGDRLLILEDGRSTGDLSSSSPDHALALDPMNADRIEIIRGPASILYSSNTMGGVINVVRGQIPMSLTGHHHGSLGLQGESVNSGLSGGGQVYGSTGNWAYKTDLSLRGAGSIRTPDGRLPNTDLGTFHAAAGLSRISNGTVLGGSVNVMTSEYGIPGDFVGAHPKGVRIRMQRIQGDLKWEKTPESGFFRRIEHQLSGSWYFHEELEYSFLRSAYDIIGTDFINRSLKLNAFWHHDGWGLSKHGQWGYSADITRLTVGGFTFTPPANEQGIAVFGFEDLHLGDWILQVSGRIDLRAVVPDEERVARIGRIRSRSFVAPSGGIRWFRPFGGGMEAGVGLMRTARLPSIKELYSEGPHLPAYSYEVGNPDLGMESGWGGEVFGRYATEAAGLQVAVFANRVANYLYPRNTGTFAVRRPLPIYQYSGDDVRMVGAEVLAEVRLPAQIQVTGSASVVNGSFRDGSPVPFMPPVNGKVNVEWTRSSLTVGAGVRWSMRQDRLGEFEEPTAGFVVPDLTLQYFRNVGPTLHTVALTAENVTDTEYRMHLSRVKSIMPEPGRNVKVLYRVYF
jgi:iron complex outermembrane receptor protein